MGVMGVFEGSFYRAVFWLREINGFFWLASESLWDRAALVPPYSETASFFGCHFSIIPRFDVLIEPPFRAGFPCALYIRATA